MEFDPGSRRYYGQRDGLSRKALFPRLARTVARTTTALVYKREVRGKENVPQEQGYVFSPNHENTFDPLIWMDLPPGDVREMVTIDVFGNPLSALAARLNGAFPIDRFEPSPVTLQHSVDVVAGGASEVIYPQGGFPGNNQIGGIFKGAAYAALKGGGKGIVPIGIHIEEKPRDGLNWKDLVAGGVLAVGVGLTAAAGAPVVAGVAAGATVAMVAAGKLARRLVPQKEAHDPMPQIAARLAGGLLGSAAGAAVGVVAAVAAPVLTPVLVAAAAVGGAKICQALRNRPVARVEIQKPLSTADYEANSEGVTRLTQDLHQSLAQAKSRLSGVPIDHSQPIFRTTPWRPGE